METKTYRAAIEIKEDGEAGDFRAVFSTLNVIDEDGDVTVPGAFTDGQKVKIAYWGHRWQDLPVGRGVIHADKEKAWVDGRFFVDTQAGKETYLTVKALSELQEWSYGFEVEKARMGQFEDRDVRFLERLTVHEVSPVMAGAGIGTHTEAIKGRKPVDVTEDTIRIRVRDPGDFEPDSFRTITISAEEHIKAVIGRLKGEATTTVQSYLFDKEHWTVEEAQAWVKEHGKQRDWDKGAGDSASDGAGGQEGEAGDGKPREWSPRDVQVQIDLLKLSTEV